MNWDSSVNIVSDYRVHNWVSGVQSLAEDFFFILIQWVLWVVSLRVKRCLSMMLTTNPHLVLRSRMSRSYTSCPPWCLHGVV
jgi:hypothetical protein